MRDRRSFEIIACIVLGIFILTGCASIVSHSNWPVLIKSTPDQADVIISDVKYEVKKDKEDKEDKEVKEVKERKEIFKGKTPTTVTLTSKGGYFRGKVYLLEVSKEGFEKKSIEIKSDLNGWFFGNILFGGLIGILIVDPLTGAMWRLNPRDIDLKLEGKAAEMPGDQRTLSILLLKDVPDQLKDKLIRIE